MTAHDSPLLASALHRLGRVMSRKVSDELVEDYFADLREFPWPVVEAAIERVRKNSNYWPRPAAIREACLHAPGVAALTEVPSWVNRDEGRYFCGVCEDTGFERGLSCEGDGACRVGLCGQTGGPTAAHAFTRRCSCRANNPVLMRQREAKRQAPQGKQEAA